jgi:hypothetical protein
VRRVAIALHSREEQHDPMKNVMRWLHKSSEPSTPPPALTPGARREVLDQIAVEVEQFALADERAAKELATAEACERDAEAMLAEARLRCAQVTSNRLTESLAHGLRVRALEARLRGGVPESIDDLINDLLVLEDETRLQLQVDVVGGSRLNELTGALSPPEVATNTSSVRRRLEAIRAARTRAEALKLEVDVSDDRVRNFLRDLPATLPEVHGAMREGGDVFSDAELRQVAWRLEEGKR